MAQDILQAGRQGRLLGQPDDLKQSEDKQAQQQDIPAGRPHGSVALNGVVHYGWPR